MRKFAFLSATLLSVTGVCLGLAADDAAPPKPAGTQVQSKDATKPAPKPEEKPAKAAKTTEAADKVPANQEPDVPSKYTADETAIRAANESLIKAYCADDAKAVAEHFTPDGEYVNDRGSVFHGREAIQDSLTEFLGDHPGCKLESDLNEIRFVSPTVAIVEGTTTVTHKEDDSVTRCNFTAVYNKNDDKWQIASVRDQLDVVHPKHEDQLEQLSWLIGDWIDEDDDSVVSFSCHPVNNGKFLVRDFSLKVQGQEVLSGTQRIGWDPLSGKLRAWIFDSEGGFSEGTWQREGDTWTLKSAGVTAEGEVASGTSVYKLVNDHSMTWQATEYQIDGVAVPDSPEFTLVHTSPHPIDHDEKAAK